MGLLPTPDLLLATTVTATATGAMRKSLNEIGWI